MAAEGNAYGNLLLLMKEQGYNKDMRIVIGTVKTLEPLVFSLNGFDIEEDDFSMTESVYNLINDNRPLETERYTEIEYKYSKPTTEPNTTRRVKQLSVNDKFLVLVDGTDFYIIDRVVS